MSTFEEFIHGLHPWLLVTAGGILVIVQVVLAIVLFNWNGSSLVANIGWVILWIAAFFGVAPIVAFRRRGGVPQGKSYMHTTKLVDTGIYAIARHPQNGVAWILISLGVMLVAQTWWVVVVGGASMVFGYLDTFKEEQRCIEKFGDEYKRYMEKVPRINFVLGIIRALQRRT
ncbi:MAG: hypothetical protein AYK19_02960 [Theionarchaea archaeon DG-70-1]|nr:MAG: hypothetical protein AYK19_02960 [Theionarchaea archaeon DG-70-1]